MVPAPSSRKTWRQGLLAEELNADTLMILTSVEKVSLDHNTDHESYLDTISTEDAKKYIAGKQFAAGSMLLRSKQVFPWRRGTGRHTIIADMAHAKTATEKTGTIISSHFTDSEYKMKCEFHFT